MQKPYLRKGFHGLIHVRCMSEEGMHLFFNIPVYSFSPNNLLFGHPRLSPWGGPRRLLYAWALLQNGVLHHLCFFFLAIHLAPLLPHIRLGLFRYIHFHSNLYTVRPGEQNLLFFHTLFAPFFCA